MRKTTIGPVCDKHPHIQGERYASNGACVLCVREAVRAYREKRVRAANGARTVFGAPCPAHPGAQGERYVSSGACVLCAREAVRRRRHGADLL